MLWVPSGNQTWLAGISSTTLDYPRVHGGFLIHAGSPKSSIYRWGFSWIVHFFKPAILVTVSPMETPDISRDMTHFSDSQAAKMCHRSQFLDFWLQSIRNTRTIGVISWCSESGNGGVGFWSLWRRIFMGDFNFIQWMNIRSNILSYVENQTKNIKGRNRKLENRARRGMSG